MKNEGPLKKFSIILGLICTVLAIILMFNHSNIRCNILEGIIRNPILDRNSKIVAIHIFDPQEALKYRDSIGTYIDLCNPQYKHHNDNKAYHSKN